MATLAADVTAEAASWNVSALPNVNYLQVDDEIVRVLDQKRTQNRLRVERGYAGTTAASHEAGAELTPVYVPGAPAVTEIVVQTTGDDDAASSLRAAAVDGEASLIVTAASNSGPTNLTLGSNAAGAEGATADLSSVSGTGDASLSLSVISGAGIMALVFGVTAGEVSSLTIIGLPTVNPNVADQIWNDGGTLKVSAG